MNDFAFLLFTTQKYSSFNPPYFPKRTLKFFLNSIPACSDVFVKKMLCNWRFFRDQLTFMPAQNLRGQYLGRDDGDTSKGQLISKCPYEKSVWTKYQRKYFCPGSLLLQG